VSWQWKYILRVIWWGDARKCGLLRTRDRMQQIAPPKMGYRWRPCVPRWQALQPRVNGHDGTVTLPIPKPRSVVPFPCDAPHCPYSVLIAPTKTPVGTIMHMNSPHCRGKPSNNKKLFFRSELSRAHSFLLALPFFSVYLPFGSTSLLIAAAVYTSASEYDAQFTHDSVAYSCGSKGRL